MIDCHLHLLPGIDDGAHDLEMALKMARIAVDSGVTAVICTPHHFNGVYDNPAGRIRRAVARLAEDLDEAGIPLSLYPGAELHLVPELPGAVEQAAALTYNDRRQAVLVELPTTTIPLGAEIVLEHLLYQGVTPVIAHPERNAVLAHDPARLGDWVLLGCKVQLTAQSCSGDFGGKMQEVCRRWLERGWVHLIASDAHRPTGRSPDKLARGRDAVAAWLGDAVAEVLTLTNPQRLLDGEPLLDSLREGMALALPTRTRWTRWTRWTRLWGRRR
jgi:protein-tyrosine phosphatase